VAFLQEAVLNADLRHLELFSSDGLITMLWHGDPACERVVLTGGGAMGSLMGPAGGLYHDLGVGLAEQGIGTLRVGYSFPGELEPCVADVLRAADVARMRGARRFVTVDHSFGGAVALQAAVALGDEAAGVVTLATQAGGCEEAEALTVPVVHIHGEADELLPPAASSLVQMLTEGRLVVYPGAGHLLLEAAAEVRAELFEFIPSCFA
jgi:pimeloyl-ACP methyl ester carboxylesterase